MGNCSRRDDTTPDVPDAPVPYTRDAPVQEVDEEIVEEPRASWLQRNAEYVELLFRDKNYKEAGPLCDGILQSMAEASPEEQDEEPALIFEWRMNLNKMYFLSLLCIVCRPDTCLKEIQRKFDEYTNSPHNFNSNLDLNGPLYHFITACIEAIGSSDAEYSGRVFIEATNNLPAINLSHAYEKHLLKTAVKVITDMVFTPYSQRPIDTPLIPATIPPAAKTSAGSQAASKTSMRTSQAPSPSLASTTPTASVKADAPTASSKDVPQTTPKAPNVTHALPSQTRIPDPEPAIAARAFDSADSDETDSESVPVPFVLKSSSGSNPKATISKKSVVVDPSLPRRERIRLNAQKRLDDKASSASDYEVAKPISRGSCSGSSSSSSSCSSTSSSSPSSTPHNSSSASGSMPNSPNVPRVPASRTRRPEAAPTSSRVPDSKTETLLSEALTCVICNDCEKTHSFIPCGHRCVCEDCGNQLMSYRQPCPICRKPIRTLQRIYV